MSIVLRYIHVPRPDGTMWKAPFVPIYVRDKEGKVLRIVALVDSGADTTVVPKDLAEVLGLKEGEAYEETGGIGGKVKVKKSKLSFEIKGGHENHSLNIPVLVLQGEGNSVPLLLGRNGFFDEFHITLRENEEKIVLKKVEKRS